MIPVVGAAWKVGLFPVWTLWLGYKGLWWAVKPAASVNQTEPDGTPRPVASPPTGALMGSFLGALGSSVAMAFAFEWLARSGRLDPQHALWAWSWSSLTVALAGLMAVRWSAKPTRTVRDRMKAAVARAKEGAGRAGNASVHALQSALEAAKGGWKPLPQAPIPSEPPVAAVEPLPPVSLPSRPAPDRAAKAVGHAVGGAARCAWNAGGRVAKCGRRALGHGLANVGQRVAGQPKQRTAV